MDDPFYNPPGQEPTLPSGLWQTILSAPPALLVTALLAPLILAAASQLFGENAGARDGGEEAVGGMSYWFPKVGRGVSLLRGFDSSSGSRSPESALFALDLGSSTKGSNSAPLKSETTHDISDQNLDPFTWKIASKIIQFFGLSAKPKYEKILKILLTTQRQHLKKIVPATIHNLELNIPVMSTFIDNPIDIQPWEKSSSFVYISPTVVSLDLFSLLQNMLGYAYIPALFGNGLLDKYPSLIQDIQNMDEGMEFFLLGLPAITPLPGVFGAHMSRRRVWEAVDGFQKVLDGLARDEEDYEWGDLSDVSRLILERNKLWRENGFKVKERGDICLLYAFLTPTHLLYNLTLHIITTPTLLASILSEVEPHITVTPGQTIGKYSSPPSLKISSEGLEKRCPLLRSVYLEILGGGKKMRGEEDEVGFMEQLCLALVAGVLTMWEFEVEKGEGIGNLNIENGGNGEIRRTKSGEGVRVRIMKRKGVDVIG